MPRKILLSRKPKWKLWTVNAQLFTRKRLRSQMVHAGLKVFSI